MKKMLLAVLTVGVALASPVQAQANQPSTPNMPGGMGGMMNKPMGQWTMQDMMQMMRGMMNTGSMNNLSGVAYDRAFLQGMTEHHQEVIERSREFAGNAKDPRVKAWANTIVKTQQAELQTFAALLKELGAAGTSAAQGGMSANNSMGMMKDGSASGNAMGGMMGMGSMGGMSMNDASTATPHNADPQRAYVSYIVAHHAAALQMASEALGKSADARVLQLARNILVDQSRDILEMKAWLKRQ